MVRTCRDKVQRCGGAGVATLLTCTAGGYAQLIVGRVIYGLGIGFAMHAAPAYIAETTPARVRGLLIRYEVPAYQAHRAKGRKAGNS